jgi:hypothetical protein
MGFTQRIPPTGLVQDVRVPSAAMRGRRAAGGVASSVAPLSHTGRSVHESEGATGAGTRSGHWAGQATHRAVARDDRVQKRPLFIVEQPLTPDSGPLGAVSVCVECLPSVLPTCRLGRDPTGFCTPEERPSLTPARRHGRWTRDRLDVNPCTGEFSGSGQWVVEPSRPLTRAPFRTTPVTPGRHGWRNANGCPGLNPITGAKNRCYENYTLIRIREPQKQRGSEARPWCVRRAT